MDWIVLPLLVGLSWGQCESQGVISKAAIFRESPQRTLVRYLNVDLFTPTSEGH